MTDPYRTKAEIPYEPTDQELALQRFAHDPQTIAALEAQRKWNEMKQGFKVVLFLGILYLIGSIGYFAWIDPVFSMRMAEYLAFIAICSVFSFIGSLGGLLAFKFTEKFDDIEDWFRNRFGFFKKNGISQFFDLVDDARWRTRHLQKLQENALTVKAYNDLEEYLRNDHAN